ncbi:MAG: D-alanyl-D-alanine carboxypeptidase family protein [Pseudomonadota bacterium]
MILFETLSPLRRIRALPTLIAATALAAAALCVSPPAAAQPSFDTSARNAVAIDADTGAVLLEKAADARIPPASMSKMMTVFMAFEAIAQGRLSLDEEAPVSEAAYQKEGSTMFLNLTDRPTIGQLLRGIIVQSGNDASIVMAEALAGTEEAFAARMTKRAREIGMRTASFKNATGLPDPEHLMSVRDLAILAQRIINDHPELYKIYSERSFEWAGVAQNNRNPLLYLDIGGDGMKTGHTEEAGYGIVGSAVRDGRRVIVVLAGLPSQQRRAREIESAISWAFREFRNVTVASKGEVVGQAEVWVGSASTVDLALAEDLRVTLPWFDAEQTEARIRYDGPVPAPIKKGDQLGTLTVQVPGLGATETALVAASDVEAGGYLSRLQGGVGIGLRWLADQLWK